MRNKTTFQNCITKTNNEITNIPFNYYVDFFSTNGGNFKISYKGELSELILKAGEERELKF